MESDSQASQFFYHIPTETAASDNCDAGLKKGELLFDRKRIAIALIACRQESCHESGFFYKMRRVFECAGCFIQNTLLNDIACGMRFQKLPHLFHLAAAYRREERNGIAIPYWSNKVSMPSVYEYNSCVIFGDSEVTQEALDSRPLREFTLSAIEAVLSEGSEEIDFYLHEGKRGERSNVLSPYGYQLKTLSRSSSLTSNFTL